MAETKVLLVEDHKLVRQAIKAILDMQENVEVVGVAEDGRQAIHMAGILKPDVIVVDFAMPNLNGLGVAYKLKSINPKIKIIFLTAYDDEEYVYQILKSGASGYLLKDSALSDLVCAIKAVEEGNLFLSPQILKKIFKRLYHHKRKIC